MTLSSSRLLEENPDRIAGRLLQKAHNRDGLPEIAIGLFFLIIAGLTWLTAVSPARSPINIASTLFLIVTMMALPVGLQWALRKVRAKFLMQKVGYVKQKPVNRKRTAIIFALAFVLAAAVALAVYAAVASHASGVWFPPASWILAATGIGGGILLAVSGRQLRSVVGGVLMAVIGISLAFSTVSLEMGFTILYGSIGIFALVSGVIVLSLLVRKPVEQGERE